MYRRIVLCISFFIILLSACQPLSVPNPQHNLQMAVPTTAAALSTVVPTKTAVIIPTILPAAKTEEIVNPYPADISTPDTPKSNENPPIYSYEVLNSYPHDPAAFTQGLIYLDGFLYEGTGRYGQSSLRQVDLETGNVLTSSSLPEQYFGEGVTVFDEKIYQLTWQNQTGFVYDLGSFELLETFSYPTEGWGLTHNGEQLIMSDGTNYLYFLNPDTLTENGRLAVHDNQGTPIARLNELEYINGSIYANIWQTNNIVRIDPETGQVTAWIDLTGLLPAESITHPVDVLNGIAYDTENGRLFVTGKLWPQLFEIKLVETAVSYP